MNVKITINISDALNRNQIPLNCKMKKKKKIEEGIEMRK